MQSSVFKMFACEEFDFVVHLYLLESPTKTSDRLKFVVSLGAQPFELGISANDNARSFKKLKVRRTPASHFVWSRVFFEKCGEQTLRFLIALLFEVAYPTSNRLAHFASRVRLLFGGCSRGFARPAAVIPLDYLDCRFAHKLTQPLLLLVLIVCDPVLLSLR